MTEKPNFYQQYEQMTPYQRNQELRGLFNALPSFEAVYPILEEVSENNLVGKFNLEETIEWANSIEARKAQRLDSPLVENLRSRLDVLLHFGLTTEYCKAYIIRRFEHFLEEGIGKKEWYWRKGASGNKTQIDQWGQDLRWDSSESGGMFSESEAQGIDAALYKRAVNKISQRRQIQEFIEQELNPDFKKEIQGAGSGFQERENKMSKEELGQLGLPEALALILVKQLSEDNLADMLIVEEWRGDHIKIFGDEP